MIAGISLVAVGIQRTLAHVHAPLRTVTAAALLGGASVYLLAHVAFRLRNTGSLSTRRLVCAVVLLALVPAGAALPALATLGMLAGVLAGLIIYEVVRYAEVRDRVRHGLAHEPLQRLTPELAPPSPVELALDAPPSRAVPGTSPEGVPEDDLRPTRERR
jgi:Bacterial low temperature requirement A protein (LtrA)